MRPAFISRTMSASKIQKCDTDYTCLQSVSKNCANLFLSERRQSYTNFHNIWQKDDKELKLYEVHSFSTSPNSRHHSTMLNADVPKCYRTLKVYICNKLSNDLAHNKLKCGLFSGIISSYKVRLKIVRNCQNLCTDCLKIEWSREMSCLRPLRDDAENVKSHLWLHGNMSLYRGWRG